MRVGIEHWSYWGLGCRGLGFSQPYSTPNGPSRPPLCLDHRSHSGEEYVNVAPACVYLGETTMDVTSSCTEGYLGQAFPRDLHNFATNLLLLVAVKSMRSLGEGMPRSTSSTSCSLGFQVPPTKTVSFRILLLQMCLRLKLLPDAVAIGICPASL